MSKPPNITEQELKGLNPCGLDEEFLSRLAACAEDTFTDLTASELEFEAKLRAIRPRAIPAALDEKLQDAISNTPFAVDGKIVLFHKSNKGKTSGSKTGRLPSIVRFNVAAAAAVALLGSLAALMLPANRQKQESPTAANTVEVLPSPAFPSAPSNFAPASYNRNLTETRDEGVIWQNNMQPHRVLRLKYIDLVTGKNSKGESIEIEQPRYEYVLIPEKVD